MPEIVHPHTSFHSSMGGSTQHWNLEKVSDFKQCEVLCRPVQYAHAFVQSTPRENLSTERDLEIAPISLANYAPVNKIVIKQQEKAPPKNESGPFLNLFLGDQNGHPEDDPRAYVLAEVGAVIR